MEQYLEMPDNSKAKERGKLEHSPHYYLGKYWVVPIRKLIEIE